MVQATGSDSGREIALETLALVISMHGYLASCLTRREAMSPTICITSDDDVLNRTLARLIASASYDLHMADPESIFLHAGDGPMPVVCVESRRGAVHSPYIGC